MVALRLGLLALVVTCAAGLRAFPFSCDKRPSANWEDHILTRFFRLEAGNTHIIVLPQHKVAFCFIQKCASEHFAAMFNQLNGIPREAASKHSNGFDPDPSTLPLLNVSVSTVSRENGWKFARFSRDPLERYLSGFLAKCVPVGGNILPTACGIDCYGPTRSKPLSVEEAVALFEKRVEFDAQHGLPPDPHWMSQSSVITNMCGLPGVDWFDPAKIDYVGHITYDVVDTNQQVQTMLRRLTSIAKVSEVVAPHFPLKASLLQCPKEHCTEANRAFNRFYRKNSTVQAVMKLLAEDYEKLQLPAPEIAKGL